MKILKYSILVLVLITMACQSGKKESEEKGSTKKKQPNILLILADDMGYSDIGPFGGEIATPTLNNLANEGLQLTNFHVLPTCSPSRSVLLSGVDNHLAGLGTMGEAKTPEMEGIPGYAGYLNFEIAALPEVMKASGYRTYMAGKWHLGDEENTLPFARGFDETFSLTPGGGSHWNDQKPLSPALTMTYHRNGKPVEALPDDFYSSKDYTDYLLEWMEKDKDDDKPFFAYMAYTAPHDPLHAPKEYVDKYKGVYNEGWDAWREKRLKSLQELGIIGKNAKSFPRLPTIKAWEEMSEEERADAARDMEVYAGMIDYLDGQIKRVIDYLKENGEYENTLIVFFSDNGANGALKTWYAGQTDDYLNSFDNSLENRGLQNSYIETGPGWAQVSMTPSRMFKAFPAEGGIRSPMLVKLPGKMENAGSMNHSFFHIRDIMPTILDLSNIQQPGKQFDGRQVEPIQGSSVLAMLEGKVSTPGPEVSEVGYELFGMKAYFDNNWKILWMPEPFSTGEWQLFNLKDDPAELNDLSKQHPDKREALISKWKQYQKDNGVLDISLDMGN